nr:hypothetical protein Iba_chr15bCG11750 [Ipomoea batatas]
MGGVAGEGEHTTLLDCWVSTATTASVAADRGGNRPGLNKWLRDLRERRTESCRHLGDWVRAGDPETAGESWRPRALAIACLPWSQGQPKAMGGVAGEGEHTTLLDCWVSTATTASVAADRGGNRPGLNKWL